MESSRTVTNKPNSRVAAFGRWVLRDRRPIGHEEDYAEFPRRHDVIKSSTKMRSFPQGRDKLLCDNKGARKRNGYTAKESWEISYPGTAQFRPEVIADNLRGSEFEKPRNTFLVKK